MWARLARATATTLACLVATATLAAGACTPDPDPPPRPDPTRTAPVGTLARAAVGDRLTVTATVHEVLTARSFVVRDVDLTNARLLVLTPRPASVRRPNLVTVAGTVVRFRYADYADRFDLSAEDGYRPYEGLKALVADQVESRA